MGSPTKTRDAAILILILSFILWPFTLNKDLKRCANIIKRSRLKINGLKNEINHEINQTSSLGDIGKINFRTQNQIAEDIINECTDLLSKLSSIEKYLQKSNGK